MVQKHEEAGKIDINELTYVNQHLYVLHRM